MIDAMGKKKPCEKSPNAILSRVKTLCASGTRIVNVNS